MPPKFKFTKEEITQAALEIARVHGIHAVTARAVGERLHASSKVIFSLFQNMEALHSAVLKAANSLYQSFLKADMESGKYPPYKASGLAYIRFAKEEKELFKLLFMRDRSQEKTDKTMDEIKPLLRLIQKNTGMSEQDAFNFHLEMWIYVHGIATMIVTGYLDWDWAHISKMLTNCYMGMRKQYLAEEER